MKQRSRIGAADVRSAPTESDEGGDDASAPLEASVDEAPKEGKDSSPKVVTAASPLPKPLRDMQRQEGEALMEYLQKLGPQGSFSVGVYREKPKMVRVNGRDYDTAGHLATVQDFVDEDYLSENFGGGTYNLRINRKNERGSFQYAAHRTVTIAGDPKVERLPVNVAPQAAPATSAPEAGGGVAKELMGLVRESMGKGEIPPAVQVVLDQMREDKRAMQEEMKRRDQEISQLRTDLLASQKPPADPWRDRLMERLTEGESVRVQAITAKHDSEIRSLKEYHLHEIKTIEDRHDRAVSREADAHAREITTLKQSFEREISSLNAAHAAALAAATTTSSVTKTTLDAEVRRLEREVGELQAQLKEVRAVKDKSIIEQIKDIKALKEGLIDGDGDGGGDTAQKIVEAIPAAIAGLGELVTSIRSQGAAQGAQAQVHAQAQNRPQPPRPRVVRDASGQRFVAVGNQLVPAKPKPKTITTDQGMTIELPQVEEPRLKLLISMLEAAFGREEDPKIVAQAAKSNLPGDILAWIRLNHTEQVSGVDLFMNKVAKLPGTSPLSSQMGREWLREVGAALLSE